LPVRDAISDHVEHPASRVLVIESELSNDDRRALEDLQRVRDLRERRAFALLREGRSNAKSIAHLLGFRDVGSFRRAFHEWTGMPVGEWCRRSIRSTTAQRPVRVPAPDRLPNLHA